MGEAVVAVVAESPDAAREAADAVLVDYEELAAVVDTLAALKPGAPVLCRTGARQYRGRIALRRCQGRRSRIRERGTHGLAGHREPAAGREPHRAAHGARCLRRGERPSHGAFIEPDADGGSHGPLRVDPGTHGREHARSRGRCGRRIRHEDGRLSRRHRRGLRGAPGEAPREMDRGTLRGVRRHGAWPRRHHACRDGA